MKTKFLFPTKLRKLLVPFVLVILVSVLYGCYIIKVIRQPIAGDPDSSFEVDIVLDPNPGDDYTGGGLNGFGLFGVMLPEGWTIEDNITYHLVSEDPEYTKTGTLSFNAAQGEALTAKLAPPSGYYWWGGKTKTELNMFKFDSLYLTIKVLTDGQLGNFKLKYAFGDTENEDRVPYRSGSISNDYPIKIGLITAAEKTPHGDFTIHPSPSTGEFSVNYGDGLISPTQMKIYNANGQVVQTRSLNNGNRSTDVDMTGSPKGMYIVAVESAGKVRTKKVLLK